MGTMNDRNRGSPPGKAVPGLRVDREAAWSDLRRALAVIGAVVAFLAGAIAIIEYIESRPAAPAAPAVQITRPSDAASVRPEIVVQGTSMNLPPECKIWIVVRPPGSDTLDPQSAPALVQPNGEWESPIVYLHGEGEGEGAGAGGVFSILAVLATPDAAAELQNYWNENEAKERRGELDAFPGIERLPDGAEVYDRIIVNRP